MTPIRSVAVFALLLVVTAVHFPIAEARNENSFKTTHYLFEPVGLLPGQDLKICVADAARVATDKQSLYFPEDMLAEINLYDAIDGTALVGTMVKEFETGMGVCFDIEGAMLGSSGGPPPEAVLAELIVSAPAESKAVPIATLELKDAASATTSALLLPALQTDDPGAPHAVHASIVYHTMTWTAGPTHIFGPLNLATGNEVEICAAEASRVVSTDIQFTFNFEEITYVVEVYDIGKSDSTPLLIMAEDIDADGVGVCFDIAADDLLGDDDGSDPPEAIVLILFLLAPAESHPVPIATGRLTAAGGDTDIALLLPAVQSAREVNP